MRTFSIAIDIPAPPGSVWQAMSDVERWHEWTASITRVTLLGDGPFAVGKRALVRQPKLPPAIWKVTELAPGRKFAWASVGPGLSVTGHHEVEPIASGTRAKLWLEYEGLLGTLLARLTRGLIERYLSLEANGLKARSKT